MSYNINMSGLSLDDLKLFAESLSLDNLKLTAKSWGIKGFKNMSGKRLLSTLSKPKIDNERLKILEKTLINQDINVLNQK